MQTVPPFSLEIPEPSRQAWEQLVAGHPEKAGESGNGLRIAVMPGFEHLADRPAEEWVGQYEHLLEAAGRRQRQAGHPQTGVFFTPKPIARYLVHRTLGHALQTAEAQIKAAMEAGSPEEVHRVFQTVKTLRIVDPACGTGVFLVEALQALTAFYREIGRLFPEDPTMQVSALDALTTQIDGMDIDPLSVMITEARLWDCVRQLDGQSGLQGQAVPMRLRIGDTLAMLPDAATGGWDFIVGNPPYVSEVRRQSERFQSLQKTGRYYRAKMDLCDAFLAWGLDHLKPGGQLAYVLPEYWTQRAGTEPVRRQLDAEGSIRELWGFGQAPVFAGAPGHHTALLIWEKQPASDASNSPDRVVQIGMAETVVDLQAERLQPGRYRLEPLTGKLTFGAAIPMQLLEKLSALPPLLKPSEIQQGIVIPQGRLKNAAVHDLPEGVFLLTNDEVQALGLNAEERALLKPYYGPAGFLPFEGFAARPPDYQLIYGDAKNRRRMMDDSEMYARLRAYLDRYGALLTSDFAPYGLHRARQPEWFEGSDRILCPRQVAVPALAKASHPAYVGEGFYVIRPEYNPDFVTTVMNSKLGWFWFYQHKRKGHRLQIDKDVLRIFPAPPAMQSISGDAAVYRLYGLTDAEIDWIEQAYADIVKA